MGADLLQLARVFLAHTTSRVRGLLAGQPTTTSKALEQLKWQYYILLRRQLVTRYRHLSIEGIFLNPSGILVFAHATDSTGIIRVLVNLYEIGDTSHALFVQPKEIFRIGQQQD